MFDFIAKNLGTISVAALLLAAVVVIMRKLYRDKKAGKTTCGVSCASCPHSGACKRKKD